MGKSIPSPLPPNSPPTFTTFMRMRSSDKPNALAIWLRTPNGFFTDAHTWIRPSGSMATTPACGQGRHAIADDAHHLPAEDGHVANLLADEMAGNLRTGDDGSYAWYLAGFGNIDATNPRVRVRTAENFAPERAG